MLAALNSASIPHMLVGGFTSNYYGIPRATKDVNVVIQLGDRQQLVEVAAALGEEFDVDLQVTFENAICDRVVRTRARCLPTATLCATRQLVCSANRAICGAPDTGGCRCPKNSMGSAQGSGRRSRCTCRPRERARRGVHRVMVQRARHSGSADAFAAEIPPL
jgi:hypothetical protein